MVKSACGHRAKVNMNSFKVSTLNDSLVRLDCITLWFCSFYFKSDVLGGDALNDNLYRVAVAVRVNLEDELFRRSDLGKTGFKLDLLHY